MIKLAQAPVRRVVAVLAATALGSSPLVAVANPEHTLTIRALDHTGAPVADGTVLVAGLGTETEFRDVPVRNGTAAIRVPKDDYLIELSRTSGRDVRVMTAVNVPVTTDTTATLDLRAAKPLTMAVPNPKASPAIIHRSYRYGRGDRAIQGDHDARDGGRLFVGTTGTPAAGDEVISTASAQWAIRARNGTFDGTPETYHLSRVEQRMITGYHRVVRPADLARIEVWRHGRNTIWSSLTEFVPGLTAQVVQFAGTPGKVVHHVDAAVRWDQTVTEVRRDPATGRWHPIQEQNQFERAYPAGRTTVERWNAAPYVPSVNLLYRSGDGIFGQLATHGDAAGHHGISPLDTARTRIYQAGKLVQETPSIGDLELGELPAAPTRYKVELSASRTVSGLARRTELTWEFDSAGTDFELLPVRVVRFRPAVDLANRLARRPVLSIPIELGTQQGAKPAPVRRVTVEVSGDDGRTWRRAVVVPDRAGYRAVVPTPTAARQLSLRAVVVDAAGGVTKQTTIGAIALR